MQKTIPKLSTSSPWRGSSNKFLQSTPKHATKRTREYPAYIKPTQANLTPFLYSSDRDKRENTLIAKANDIEHQLHSVAPDGNCYEAIATITHQLRSKIVTQKSLRNSITDYFKIISNNPDKLKFWADFIRDEEDMVDLSDYRVLISRILKINKGAWADNVEIQAISNTEEINIIIHTPNSKTPIRTYPEGDPERNNLLSFH